MRWPPGTVVVAASISLGLAGCNIGLGDCLDGSGCYRSQYASLWCTAPSFGPVPLGQAATLYLSIENQGNTATTMFVLGAPPAPFRFEGGSFPGTGGTCGTSVDAMKDCTVVLRFAPTSAEHYSVFSYGPVYALPRNQDLSQAQASCDLDGTGVQSPAPLSISPAPPHDFGPVPPPASAGFTFTVGNTTAASLAMDCARFGIDGGYGFSLAGGSCCDQSSLLPGTTCTVGVTFTPITGTISRTDLGSLFYASPEGVTLSNRVELLGRAAP